MTTDEKEKAYGLAAKQIEAVISGETDAVANMANISAILHDALGSWWTGFYIVKGDELVLGPFQGPAACTRIGYGRGVCGTSWKEERSVVVPDVEQFPGHIACSSASRSEVVVPVWNNGKIKGVIDIDSRHLAAFDECDRRWLEKIAKSISGAI